MFYRSYHDVEFCRIFSHTVIHFVFRFGLLLLRFRNNMSMRFHTTILCVFECEKTYSLRFHNTPLDTVADEERRTSAPLLGLRILPLEISFPKFAYVNNTFMLGIAQTCHSIMLPLAFHWKTKDPTWKDAIIVLVLCMENNNWSYS